MLAPGKPATCEGCPLSLIGKGFVRGDGPSPADILIVGEAPGEHEAKTGKPFVGQAGRMLDNLLSKAGLDRATFRVANTICCQPPKNYLSGAVYEDKAIAHCAQYLNAEIAATKPKVIIALGGIALKRLQDIHTKITVVRGFPLKHSSGAWIVPTYHPSFMLPRAGQKDTAKLTGIVLLDLKRAVDIATHGFTRPEPAYTMDPSPEEAFMWATAFENACLRGDVQYLSWDIETPGKLKAADENESDDELPLSKTITRIGFSYKPGVALSIPWQAPYMPAIRKLLEYPCPQVTWNGFAFDIPIVKANGINLPADHQYDGMWAWHLLQSDLPRGLQAVASVYCPEVGPWKHLFDVDMPFYNSQDADVALRIMIGVERDLRTRGAWDLYKRHVVDLFPIVFEAGRLHGVHVDIEQQQTLAKELTAAIHANLREAQAVVPDELKTVKLYKKPPKGKTVTPFSIVPTVLVCSGCGKKRPPLPKNHHDRPGPCKGQWWNDLDALPTTVYRWTPDWNTIPDDQLEDVVAVAGFNPVSTKQLIKYAKHHKHPIGENYKTGSDQLDRTVRDRLIKKYGVAHPIYALSKDAAEASKAMGTYVSGYRPDASGRIYTSYTFAPSTGRLSSRNVNLQNVARGGNNRWAPMIRKAIIPPPGHVFVEADSSAIEAVLTGYFMEDPDYINLARLGIHDYVTCHKLDIPFDPSRTSELRKDPRYEALREVAKRTVHLTNYGGTPKMMVMAAPHVFTSEKLAVDMQATYFAACPKLGPWQHDVRLQAHRQTYLQNPWGYRHYFYAVFARNWNADTGAVTIVPGTDSKRVVAFLPQSSAAAIMRDTLLLVGQSEWRPYTPAILSIHDSVCLAVPDDDATVGRAVTWLADTMTRPIPELGGLRIGCEVKVGKSWDDMHKVLTRRVE